MTTAETALTTSSHRGLFVVERSERDARMPFRIRLESGAGKVIIQVRCRHPWPGAGAQLFCLRDDGAGGGYVEVERVSVIEWSKVGNRLAFSLDRPNRKRADFLKVIKGRAGDQDQEMVFFRTQMAVEAHKSRGAPVLYGKHDVRVVVDSAERYPWVFGSPEGIERRKLQAGDYAAVVDEAIVAVIERKSFPDFLTCLYGIASMHGKLRELSAYRHAAVAVEGQYADLFSRKKIGTRCKPAHLARLVAELAVMHPKVPVVWCGSRKDANAWAVQFFEAATREARQVVPDSIAETPDLFANGAYEGGEDQTLRADIQRRAAAAGGTGATELRDAHPSVDAGRIQRVLQQLRREGHITTTGKGRGTRWVKQKVLGPA